MSQQLATINESEKVQETNDLLNKLKKFKNQVNQLFLEREELVNLYLSCMVSGYPIFVGGLPGTGKTALAKLITQSFEGKPCYRLLQASSTLEEVVGSIDLAALDKSQFRRKLDNGIVMADTAILDEIFKANNVVLNALLGLILDKKYQNGDDGEIKSPLNMVVGCSNELPSDDSLQAFWDRFLVRFWVYELSPANKMILMKRRAKSLQTPKVNVSFTKVELNLLKQESENVAVPDEILTSILEITNYLRDEIGVLISDRRHEQIVDISKAYALVLGKDTVDDECLEILCSICWDNPNQIGNVRKALSKFGNPLTSQAKQFYEHCQTLYKQLPEFDSEKGDADNYRINAGSVKIKIKEKIDILQGKINEIGKNQKTRAAQSLLEKLVKLTKDIDAKMFATFSVPTKTEKKITITDGKFTREIGNESLKSLDVFENVLNIDPNALKQSQEAINRTIDNINKLSPDMVRMILDNGIIDINNLNNVHIGDTNNQDSENL